MKKKSNRAMRAILLILGCCLAGARARVDLFKQLEIFNITERLRLIAPEQVLRKYDIARENGSECERDVALYEEAIRRRESWALRMLDSSSKVPMGVLRGNVIDLGMYDECMAARAPNIRSRHCMYSIRPQDNDFVFPIDPKMSICLPASCTDRDIVELFNGAINRSKELKGSGLVVSSATCTSWNNNRLSVWEIALIILASFYLYFLFCCTMLDLSKRLRKPGDRINLEEIRSTTRFSILRNAETIFDLKSQEGDMPFIHGIRVINSIWIALFHEYIVRIVGSVNDLMGVSQWYSSRTGLIIFMAMYAVDSFLAISGFLVSYNFFRKVEKTKKFINVPLYYLHRYVRLTLPPTILVFLSLVLFPLISSGAQYESIIDMLVMRCSTKWWAILLYLHNLVDRDNYCYLHLWSLSVDMQLYLVSPLILYALYKKPKIGLTILGLLILGSGLITTVLFRYNNYSALYVTLNPNIPHVLKGLHDVYMQSYTRAIPWLIGVYFGYELTHKSVKLTKNVIAVGWFLTAFSFTFCIYGTRYVMLQSYEYNVTLEALFAPLSKVFWSFGICWIIYACSNDAAGLITKILSYKYFRPLSKISYCFYLIHITFPGLQTASSRSPIDWNNFVILHSFIGNVIISFVAAFIFCILFEMPMLVLDSLLFKEKAELQRDQKNKETSNSITKTLKIK